MFASACKGTALMIRYFLMKAADAGCFAADAAVGRKDQRMISFVRGPLVEVDEDVIVVEAGGVGYNIHVPLSLLESLPPLGSEVRIYTYLRVQEDAMTLYGFGSRQDLKIFRQLLGVNGVGPKGGLALLSAMGPADLRLAIVSGDAKAISRAPGIGIKTAQRVILDLRERVSMEDVLPSLAEPAHMAGSGGTSPDGAASGAAKEAVDALVALGYTPMEAAKAVRSVGNAEEMTPEEILKASLRYLL